MKYGSFIPALVFSLFLASCDGGDPQEFPETPPKHYSPEELMDIRTQVEEYWIYWTPHGADDKGLTPVAGNITWLGIYEDKNRVFVGLFEYTPETVAAFIEEIFPGQDPDTLPIVFEQGEFIPRGDYTIP